MLLRSSLILLLILKLTISVVAKDNRTDSLISVINAQSEIIIVDSLNKSAYNFIVLGNYKHAIDLVQQSLYKSKAIGYKKGMAVAYSRMGTALLQLSDLSASLNYLEKSLQISEEIHEDRILAGVLSNIGSIYNTQKRYDKSLEYYRKANDIFIEYDEEVSCANMLNNIGLVQYYKKEYDSALDSYYRALEFKSKHSDSLGLATIYSNIGLIYADIGNNSMALKNYKTALIVSVKLDDRVSIGRVCNNFGDYYLKQNKLDSAKFYYFKSLEASKSILRKASMRFSYEKLAELYEKQNEFETAFHYYRLFTQINDSIFTAQIVENLANLEVRKEILQREQKIELLNKDKLLKESEIARQRYFIFSLIFLVGITITFLLVFFFQKREKSKANVILLNTNLEIVESEKQLLFVKNEYEAIIKKYELKEETKKLQNKYATSTLDEFKKEELIRSIVDCLENQKMFLDQDFTINKLANHIGVSRTYISQVINENFGKNFNHLVNEFRIKEARRILSDPINQKYTIETIANMTGFNSKSTFNSAFKKHTGITPSYFLKSSDL